MSSFWQRSSRTFVATLRRWSARSLCAPLVFAAALGDGTGDATESAPAPPPPPSEPVASAPWYRPTAAEARPPADVRYVPIGVLVEPQLAVGSLQGTLATLLATIPLGRAVGILVGAQLSDAPRFTAGIDFLRYAGKELAITTSPSAARISVILAPTVGVQSFIGAGVVGGDGWIAPVGLRAVVDAAHSMAELRFAGHLLIGGQTDATSQVNVVGTAGTLGLQLVIAPLFATSRAATSHRASSATNTASLAGAPR